MTTELAHAIIRIWDAFEEAEPDISTERLMEMTVQAASALPQAPRQGFYAGDVCEAIEITEKEKQRGQDDPRKER